MKRKKLENLVQVYCTVNSQLQKILENSKTLCVLANNLLKGQLQELIAGGHLLTWNYQTISLKANYKVIFLSL
jgi:hypothetical protein